MMKLLIFWLKAYIVCAEVKREWTTPADTGVPNNLAWELWTIINNVLNLRATTHGIPAVPSTLGLTTREIGYCPDAHLDVFDFGASGQITRSTTFMNMYSYFILPDTLSLRSTGAWYASAPMNLEMNSDDGYCLMMQGNWTASGRYASAEGTLQASYGGVQLGTPDFVTNTIIDWYKEITHNRTKPPPVLRTVGEDGRPVQRLMITSGPNIPRLKDLSSEARLTKCPDSYCLAHVNVTYNEIMEENCHRRISSNAELRKSEDELNEYLCPLIEEYRIMIIKGAYNDTVNVGLNILSTETIRQVIDSAKAAQAMFEADLTEQTDFLEQMTEVMLELKSAGYTLTGLGESSVYCPPPEVPTKAELLEVLQYIQPDMVSMISKQYTWDVGDDWITEMNEFMKVFDGIVPVERRFVDQHEGAILAITDLLSASLCKSNATISTTPVPTLAPDGPAYCYVGDQKLPPHESSTPEDEFKNWHEACQRHRWSITYSAIMAGSLAGSVLTVLLWHCCSCLDTEEEQWGAVPNQTMTEAVLFAH